MVRIIVGFIFNLDFPGVHQHSARGQYTDDENCDADDDDDHDINTVTAVSRGIRLAVLGLHNRLEGRCWRDAKKERVSYKKKSFKFMFFNIYWSPTTHFYPCIRHYGTTDVNKHSFCGLPQP